MKKLYLFMLLSLTTLGVVAQPGQRTCKSQEYLESQIRNDPERGRKLEALEKRVADLSMLKGKPGGGPERTWMVYVPVVVNVVYNSSTMLNQVSAAQAQSQIEVLNEDYQKLNAEFTNPQTFFAMYKDLADNTKIAFCLQEVRYQKTSVVSFTGDAVKYTAYGGLDALEPTRFLNIWVCVLGNDLLGYAQFPGGRAATDGVVCDYRAFGTLGTHLYPEYDMGRTLTHEIGHWFGLYHIWGTSKCGSDKVDDTPLHDGPNFGCPGVATYSACRGQEVSEMWMNYMDYSDDACLYMFTQKQKTRMDGFIATDRIAYCNLTAPCGDSKAITRSGKPLVGEKSPGIPTLDMEVAGHPGRGSATLVITTSQAGTGEISVLSLSGGVYHKSRLAMAPGTLRYSLNLPGLPAGLYMVRLQNGHGQMVTRKLMLQ